MKYGAKIFRRQRLEIKPTLKIALYNIYILIYVAYIIYFEHKTLHIVFLLISENQNFIANGAFYKILKRLNGDQR